MTINITNKTNEKLTLDFDGYDNVEGKVSQYEDEIEIQPYKSVEILFDQIASVGCTTESGVGYDVANYINDGSTLVITGDSSGLHFDY